MGGRWSSDQEPPNATNEIGVSELPEEGKAKRSRRSLEPVEEETHMSAKRSLYSYAVKKRWLRL